AAKAIYDRYGCAALVKGGHSIQDASDVLYDGCFTWFEGKRIDCQNTHGTGCTLSSAIASNLSKGYNLVMAIELAKQYISGALQNDMDLGFGSGPLNHGWRIR
ncbi:MAG: bifunctional hydroxymethylpyrimidine kinase/phosphomethylpyrimidine kinase, partial [Oscillospiraceae bacterium]|nr:bifunctional hydroxymethylpyrimidine kinase/phosphomethylpyrimidine kinase [Oscillospiraceae bacterium]